MCTADVGRGMLRPAPPMSNTERQRRFRERNPGYYQRLHAKRRAQVQALHQQMLREKAIARIIAPQMPHPEQLCLPAPEQVSTARADQLLRDIQQATAQRADASPMVMKVEQADLRDAA